MNLTDRYSEQLVLRVNELFHDLSEGHYADVHEEILGAEGERWQRIAPAFLPPPPRVIADIGTGMGMVPVSIGRLLTADDHVIAADISQKQLDAARVNIERERFPWSVEYVKLEPAIPFRLPFADSSLDVVTMNSVLHHIKETAGFLAEVDRILKPGGSFVVAHEPNAVFTESKGLWWSYRALYALLNPRFALRSRPARALGIYRLAMAVFARLRPDKAAVSRRMVDEVNRKVLAEKLIDRPLTLDELGEITDILDNVGFHPRRLMPEYEVMHLETYNPLGQLSIERDRGVVRAYGAWLQRRRPEAGATFFLALRKPTPARRDA
jgi:ubiquinone/menaquinone biosynthesis C-methylase UbiE